MQRRLLSTAGSGGALVISDGASRSARSTIRAAQSCAPGRPIDILLFGSSDSSSAERCAQWPGVRRILVADAGVPLAERCAPVIAARARAETHSHVLCAASTFGKNVLPRVAGLLGVSALSDVTEVSSAGVYTRPIYAGNALAEVRSTAHTHVLTIRATAFEPVDEVGGNATVEALPAKELESGHSGAAARVRWLREDKSASGRPELGAAGVVVSGGRGLQSRENFGMLEKLADKLGGAVGATRAAVDAGFAKNDLQVGQTGKVVAPELYIAVGLSGAIQHLAGMKDSKVIVAINKDQDAPIFQVADYGLVGDLFKVIPELEKKIEEVLP